jgi:hypothetical protein
LLLLPPFTCLPPFFKDATKELAASSHIKVLAIGPLGWTVTLCIKEDTALRDAKLLVDCLAALSFDSLEAKEYDFLESEGKGTKEEEEGILCELGNRVEEEVASLLAAPSARG